MTRLLVAVAALVAVVGCGGVTRETKIDRLEVAFAELERQVRP